MNDIFYPLLVAIVLTGFGIIKAIIYHIDSKFNLLDKKIDTLLTADGIDYPKVDHVSKQVWSLIKRSDRNKASDLIIKETDCTKAQALTLIEKLEKLNMP